MKKLQKLFAMTAVAAMLASPAYSQEPVAYCEDCSPAYCESECASNMSVWIPVGALVVAGVIIATTNRGHHHSCCESSCTFNTHCY
jgi:hypothetical protein